MSELIFNAAALAHIFPPERTDAFFGALYGDAEDGAYDIVLVWNRSTERRLDFLFELRRRGNACLACNLTHGLPRVFERHPVLNVRQVATDLAALAGWPEGSWRWAVEDTQEISEDLHVVPLVLTRTGRSC